MVKIRSPKHFYDQLFKQNFYFSIGVKSSYFIAQIKKYLGIVYEKDLSESAGHCISFGHTQGSIIWVWVKNKSLTHIIHEANHAVCFTFQNVSLNHVDANDELYSYYLEMLVKIIRSK